MTLINAASEAALSAWQQIEKHKDKLWYMACAYSGKNKFEVEENLHESMMIAALLLKEGLHIHHPTYMTHQAALMFDLPGNYEWWTSYNEHFIDASYGMLVCRRGMKTSRGVKHEIQYARTTRWQPVFVVDRMGDNLAFQELYQAWPEL